MKKIGLFVSMLLLSSFYIVGCGGGGSGGDFDDPINDQNNPPVISYPLTTAIVVDSTFDPLVNVQADDVEDGDLTGDIVIVSNDVNTSAEGNYTVEYSVTDSDGATTTATRVIAVVADVPVELPDDLTDLIDGDGLACTPMNTDDNVSNDYSDDANETNASETFKRNVSTASVTDLESRRLQTSHSSIDRLDMVMLATAADGTPTGELNDDGNATEYHPLVVNYLEHIEGSDYEQGDGSADIGDPDNVDRVMLSLSRDNGQTWKPYIISNTQIDRSSIDVEWAGETIAYPQDAQKPTMAANGKYIMVAWNDKLCHGNPLDLPSAIDPETNKTIYPTDIFAVNGPQGSIDYGEEDNVTGVYSPMIAPNGKLVYEVPFSCVWTARGIIDEITGEIDWHAPMQLTSGVRDSNHIQLAASSAGFAIAWHEDPVGLKAGEGAGPGEGWSGATGNRGTDVWYTSIKLADFEATAGVDVNDTNRSISANNFHYPVRVTDNEQCQDTDQKAYCEYYCSSYGTITTPKGNQSGDDVTRCLTNDTDWLTGTISVLDGDTGASRPVIKTFSTNAAGEVVVVLGYEETKALRERVSGEGDQDQGEVPTDIAVEGKSVYFESFDFKAIDAFDNSDPSTIATTAMPIVSAGDIINVKVPRSDDTVVGTPGEMIYENARRLVIGGQIDSCDANETGDRTFAIMYKQSFEVQGASSDMFIRTWEGFEYEDIAQLDGRDVTNVSAQELTTATDPADYNVSWTEANLDANTYENNRENTFSPRIFLRGESVYIGYAYTPYETIDGEQLPGGGKFPSNFHTNLFIDGSWSGPVNVTGVTDSSKSTLDPRFSTTPKGSFDETGLESDKSNPNVLFVSWGSTVQGEEADVFFRRSTDNGLTWEDEKVISSIQLAVIQEKEVQSFASPDGKTLYNVWLQQSEIMPSDTNITTGLDTWFGRVDFNITAP
jgi:hypothetical protein